MLVNEPDDLYPKVPPLPVIAVDTRVQQVEGDVHSIYAAATNQRSCLLGNLWTSHRPSLLAPRFGDP